MAHIDSDSLTAENTLHLCFLISSMSSSLFEYSHTSEIYLSKSSGMLCGGLFDFDIF